MSGGWSYEQTRALVGVWSQANVQGELDGVTRNRVVFECIAQRRQWERWTMSSRGSSGTRRPNKHLTHK